MNFPFECLALHKVARKPGGQAAQLGARDAAQAVDHCKKIFDGDETTKPLGGARFDLARSRIAHARVGSFDILAAALVAEEVDIALHNVDGTPLARRIAINPSGGDKLIEPLARQF
jgi:hypothetical protein